ncbi:YetF domain-containing protein [Hyphobacterium sp.]|uniref:YetF domain-containing protein n=1 Tax=Hyphobacterium sp. TaxID=2004662 RepID=UPI003B52ABFC
MTEADLYAKLREANVLEMSAVRAAVLEQTGDVSVLHGDTSLDNAILDGVRSAQGANA